MHMNHNNSQKKEEFYQELGRIVSQSGIAEVFGITPDQPLSYMTHSVKKLIGFFAYHCDETLEQDEHKYLSQL